MQNVWTVDFLRYHIIELIILGFFFLALSNQDNAVGDVSTRATERGFFIEELFVRELAIAN
jgi:hypothetical protein